MPKSPIAFEVARFLRSQCCSIATDSGYHHDVDADSVLLDPDFNAERFQDPSAPLPMIVLVFLPDEREYESDRGVKVTIPFQVYWLGTFDPTDGEGKAREFFSAASDLERALQSDYTCGGRAADLVMSSPELLPESSGSRVWVSVDVSVTVYRTIGEADEVVS